VPARYENRAKRSWHLLFVASLEELSIKRKTGPGKKGGISEGKKVRQKGTIVRRVYGNEEEDSVFIYLRLRRQKSGGDELQGGKNNYGSENVARKGSIPRLMTMRKSKKPSHHAKEKLKTNSKEKF